MDLEFHRAVANSHQCEMQRRDSDLGSVLLRKAVRLASFCRLTIEDMLQIHCLRHARDDLVKVGEGKS
ncbi:hypothetical protein AOLI_G00329000 [Acnodon oligacanthus]